MPPLSRSLSWIGLAFRVLAGGVWIVSGVAKLPDLAAFRVLVERYELLPRAFAVPFSYGLPFVEIGVGLYLLAGLFTRGSAFVGTCLMLLFLAAQVQAMARGLAIDCGCFGNLALTRVGFGSLVRDFVLGIPTFLMLAKPSRFLSLDALLFGTVDRFFPPRGPAVPQDD